MTESAQVGTVTPSAGREKSYVEIREKFVVDNIN